MNDKQIIKELAEKVMGWRVEIIEGHAIWYDGKYRAKADWNSFNSWADAGMLMERARESTGYLTDITMYLDAYEVHVEDDNETTQTSILAIHRSDLAPRAISMAIAKAYGIINE